MGFFGGGGSSVDLASPPAIGSTTPNTGAFTTLSANSTISFSATGTRAAPTIQIRNANSGIYSPATGWIGFATQGVSQMQIGGSSGVLLSRDIPFGWANDVNDPSQQGSNDLIIRRDAANTFAQRNSTNAQTFRLYNTYTDASNYERGFFRWSSNVLEIGAEAAGTGTQRTISFLGGSNNSAISFTSNSLNAIFGNNANIFYKNIQSEASIRFSGSDLGISRNAAGVMELNNGTAGTFRDLIVRNLRMSAPTLVPASASATGSEGQISWDASYIYVCTATNTWKRVAIATWP